MVKLLLQEFMQRLRFISRLLKETSTFPTFRFYPLSHGLQVLQQHNKLCIMIVFKLKRDL